MIEKLKSNVDAGQVNIFPNFWHWQCKMMKIIWLTTQKVVNQHDNSRFGIKFYNNFVTFFPALNHVFCSSMDSAHESLFLFQKHVAISWHCKITIWHWARENISCILVSAENCSAECIFARYQTRQTFFFTREWATFQVSWQTKLSFPEVRAYRLATAHSCPQASCMARTHLKYKIEKC